MSSSQRLGVIETAKGVYAPSRSESNHKSCSDFGIASLSSRLLPISSRLLRSSMASSSKAPQFIALQM